MKKQTRSAEGKRLTENAEHAVFWKQWGPYLSERQWGTVREDYSDNGEAWGYFPFDHAHSRVYRWGEDGLGGISDIQQNLCFALALWNGQDPILKERLFGLSNKEGNHGEDVKELYYYLDNTPTHSYMKFLYKYPQAEFPYRQLREINRHRTRLDPEYELLDTGVFDHDRYFDVFVEYAKAAPDDVLIRINVSNRGDESADITVLPTLWFRNTWSVGKTKVRPDIRLLLAHDRMTVVEAPHEQLGTYVFASENNDGWFFTENETNRERLFNVPNASPLVKDAFHDAVITGNDSLLRQRKNGTKYAPVYRLRIAGGDSRTIRLRLASRLPAKAVFGGPFEKVFEKRIAEADEFYQEFIPEEPVSDVVQVQRQAYAGLLWNKQYYNYEVETWLNGDTGQPAPPEVRKEGRNHNWPYLFNRDIISMPDTWEYPWYASWDLAFHCVPLSRIDPDFAKKQLILFLREWYMHPNGQIPAYEWNLGDVNPPVHAWAALKVYHLEKKMKGRGDIPFLKRVFHKLLLNFTWWVNRKDSEGHNIFQGGFLGLDNIGIFDRSRELPTGGHIEQADGTSWMAMYSLNLMDMALEIATEDPAYEDVASKFFEHFVHIAESLNEFGEQGLWNEEDGFYYDALHLPGGEIMPLKVRSLVGLTSLLAVSVINKDLLDRMKGFRKRLFWFLRNRRDLNKCITVEELHEDRDMLLSLTPRDRLVRILQKMLDEHEFLASGGIRSVSRYHRGNPFVMKVNGDEYRVDYEPAESVTTLFGGNSNWRGPIWVQINYLFIESLKKYYAYYGESLKVEYPTGSGNLMSLWEVAKQLSQRVSGIFTRDAQGRRPVHGDEERYCTDPHFRDLVLFYEYFHGDTCRGLGASHQTGWTGLVAEMIEWCWCAD
ncbi:MAG: glucosidase [Nitrospirae bacterium]|nr:glucosidase [Nitrospirota bacterium]